MAKFTKPKAVKPATLRVSAADGKTTVSLIHDGRVVSQLRGYASEVEAMRSALLVYAKDNGLEVRDGR